MIASADVLIDKLRADHRVLIVFAPDAGDAKLAEQRREFGDHAAAMRERDVTLIEVVGDTVRRDGEALDASAAELRRRQNVDAAVFAVHLIGKDGGTKLRRDKPVEMKEIVDLIDSMPMRQREAKERE
jgi:hypothetical protein